MKSLALFILLALTTSAFAATAPAPAPGCDYLRQAQATIVVMKYTYVQQNGIWVQQGGEVGRAATTAPVIGDNMSGCKMDTLRLDNILVNGNPETINVTAYIHIDSKATPNPIKRFEGSYWLSANNGRDGWAAIDTEDLKFNKVSLALNVENSATTATAHDDVITVYITYNDNAN